MRSQRAGRPVPLPVQALDHATGYLMAAAAIAGLAKRRREGSATTARLSLARTASLLCRSPAVPSVPGEPIAARDDDYGPEVERTAWGAAKRLRPQLAVTGVPMSWDLPAGRLGSSQAGWGPSSETSS